MATKSSDLTFITNENNRTLLDRFNTLIKDTRYFDVLVGYFYTSGFYALYKSLENTEKIRILIGISTNKQAIDLIKEAEDQIFQFSHAQTKNHFSNMIIDEISNSQDNRAVESGVYKFLEWLKSGKLEIKAYPTEKIHAKLYVMTFAEGDRDRGRIITGSSNFTKAGMIDNLEFNVELKNPSDYDYALDKFNELWISAVDVKDTYIETIKEKTWLNNTITPYQLYLKFLYEYFKDEISRQQEILFQYIPERFKKLEYQEQAVLNAKKILDEYGGVFLSDVVGLGKTYMAAMLASQLDGRTLVIAPPVLLDRANPGSWTNVFSDFRIAADFESLGKLDQLLKIGTSKYRNVFIDEAHRFRSESNVTYEKLAEICRGKRIILVTATPFNNRPRDILSQIKLFQKSKKSTIPGLPNLEAFFSVLENRIKDLDRQRDHKRFIETSKDNALEIREKVLKYLMVRRTRKEIDTYFKKDLEKQHLKFPQVENPEAIFYELSNDEDKIFGKTIELLAQKFTYARYTPMLYYRGQQLDQLERQSQKNMGKFMKILLVKRLESSFYAFKNSVARFIHSYNAFLDEYDNGFVYSSKKYSNKIFELLENDDIDGVQKLIDEEKASKYSSSEFNTALRDNLLSDLQILKEVDKLWAGIHHDPKLNKFISILSSRNILKESKLIVFTESKETASYLAKNIEDKLKEPILLFTGGSSAIVREQVIENFDANAHFPKSEFRILITTEVLSEGVNLHRSNVVINYDIPWNPTRLMQRVGRINRVDTNFDKIYTFNFFPTKQANDQIKLKEAAEAKIHTFITLLGADARLLTEGEEIESHELFNRLISKKTIIGDDEGEESVLKYLSIIRDIRDNDPDVFAQIKLLPRKARTAKKYRVSKNTALTYFRKGRIQKFFIVEDNTAKELDFMSAAKTLEAKKETTKESIGDDFYDLLEKNKKSFEVITIDDIEIKGTQGGRDTPTQLLKILKAVKDYRQFTEDQEDYLKRLITQLEEGAIPKQTAKTALQELNKESGIINNPLKILAVIEKNIPIKFLEGHYIEGSNTAYTREVILSEYLIAN
jgi:superfamily II DNA or RNA helicase/HKD family nuclease